MSNNQNKKWKEKKNERKKSLSKILREQDYYGKICNILEYERFTIPTHTCKQNKYM